MGQHRQSPPPFRRKATPDGRGGLPEKSHWKAVSMVSKVRKQKFLYTPAIAIKNNEAFLLWTKKKKTLIVSITERHASWATLENHWTLICSPLAACSLCSSSHGYHMPSDATARTSQSQECVQYARGHSSHLGPFCLSQRGWRLWSRRGDWQGSQWLAVCPGARHPPLL